jgi:hypothetical protein
MFLTLCSAIRTVLLADGFFSVQSSASWTYICSWSMMCGGMEVNHFISHFQSGMLGIRSMACGGMNSVLCWNWLPGKVQNGDDSMLDKGSGSGPTPDVLNEICT